MNWRGFGNDPQECAETIHYADPEEAENADVVMFIHRPEMYAHNRDKRELEGIADLIVAKQRDGATGKAKLVFLHSQTRFESATEDSVQ